MIHYLDYRDNFTEYTYRTYIKFGKFQIIDLISYAGCEFRISWRQGNNYYSVVKLVNFKSFYSSTAYISYLDEIVKEMINIRDTKIRSVTFWTNCKDVR